MKSCMQWEGIIAQSLYEPLESHEQAALETHLATCHACSDAYASLAQVKEMIPAETVPFTGDLRRILEDEVRAMGSVGTPRYQWIARLRGIAAIFVVIFGVFFYANFIQKPSETLTAILVAETTDLIAQQKYTRAYVLLNEHLNDPARSAELDRAKVHGILAELSFSRLRWYPEAHESFKTLRAHYPEQFQSSQDYRRIVEILEESHAISTDYASLKEWDRLNRNSDISIAALEGYIQTYPATHQATEAVFNIARCMVQYADVDHLQLNQALETALVDHENPVVVGQIKLVLGRYYWEEENNPEKAARVLKEVVSGPIPVLSNAAHTTLASLQN